ncbi:hypothetical protein ABK040_005574 [Willaertia magna]
MKITKAGAANKKKIISFDDSVDKVKFIKYGEKHVVLITFNNIIYGYGDNSKGQLGLGTILKTNEEFVKVELNQEVKSKNYTQLECGYTFTVIVCDNNEIFTSGVTIQSDFLLFNRVIFFNKDIKFIRAGIDSFYIVTKNNELYMCGIDYMQYNLDLEETLTRGLAKVRNLDLEIKDIQCGHHSAIILDTSGNIYGFGVNWNGQLGLGDTKDRIYKSYGDYNIFRKDKVYDIVGEIDGIIEKSFKMEFLNFENNKYYNLFLLKNNLLIVQSEYKIDDDFEEYKVKECNLLQKLQNVQLCDIEINCESKKRKRYF